MLVSCIATAHRHTQTRKFDEGDYFTYNNRFNHVTMEFSTEVILPTDLGFLQKTYDSDNRNTNALMTIRKNKMQEFRKDLIFNSQARGRYTREQLANSMFKLDTLNRANAYLRDELRFLCHYPVNVVDISTEREMLKKKMTENTMRISRFTRKVVAEEQYRLAREIHKAENINSCLCQEIRKEEELRQLEEDSVNILGHMLGHD